jgi:hypothetical protein
MRTRPTLAGIVASIPVFAAATLAAIACSTGKSGPLDLGPAGDDATVGFGGDDAAGSPMSSGDDGGMFSTGPGSAPPSCSSGSGWRCSVNASCGSSPTTLTGKVYDPAGKNPLYNVVVFIPNDASKLPTIAPGTHTCNTCDTSVGDYVAVATTDATGSFTLTDVPTGKGVPVVVQIGKWRRLVSVDTKDCATTAAPAGALRLPRNRSEGSIPQMALLTGGFDNLGCFPAAIGLDPKEYSAPHGGGSLDVYQGLNTPLGATIGNGPGLSGGTAGNCTNANCPLWSTKPDLEAYDLVLLACEGDEANQTKPASAMQAMHDWLDEGGKVFATHFHYTWFKNSPSPDFQNVATWLGTSVGFGAGNFAIDTGFPKGKVFHDWLVNVGALTNNAISLTGVGTSVSSVNGATNRWIYDGTTTPADTKYLSFGTPIGGAPVSRDGGSETSGKQYCGKAVFTDLHAGGAPAGDIPASCAGSSLTPQLEALEFLFFDLAACVQDDSQAPAPPPPPVR